MTTTLEVVPPALHAIKCPIEGYDFAGEDVGWLTQLSRLNLLVGPNNTGKSRLLRSLFFEDCSYVPVRPERQTVMAEVEAVLDLEEIVAAKRWQWASPHDAVANRLRAFRHAKQPASSEIVLDLVRMRELYSSSLAKPHVQPTPNTGHADFNDLKRAVEEKRKRIPSLVSVKRYEDDWLRIYVPVLRAFRPLATGKPAGSHILEDTFIRDYFKGLSGSDKKRQVRTGERLHEEFLKYRLGDKAERERLEEYEAFLSAEFFDNRVVELLPKNRETEGISDVVWVGVSPDKERPIFHLGDGIQQIIAITFDAFMESRNKGVLLFVEEPELFLHPELQRKLLTTLLRHPAFKNVIVVATTHSNHVLDMSTDYEGLSLYKVMRPSHASQPAAQPAPVRVLRSSHRDHGLWLNLGVRASSVFIANCTIWVEGITDRLYLRRYLELLYGESGHRRFTEDLHYAFVEYGGANLSHFHFGLETTTDAIQAQRLSGRIFLVADNDGDKKGARRQRLEDIERVLTKEQVSVLPVREIENLVSKPVLLAALQGLERAPLSPETDADFLEKDYQKPSMYLGRFIEERIFRKDAAKLSARAKRADGDGKQHPYSMKSGTLKPKVEFAEEAIKATTSVSLMSKPTIELVEKIYAFIARCNPR